MGRFLRWASLVLLVVVVVAFALSPWLHAEGGLRLTHERPDDYPSGSMTVVGFSTGTIYVRHSAYSVLVRGEPGVSTYWHGRWTFFRDRWFHWTAAETSAFWPGRARYDSFTSHSASDEYEVWLPLWMLTLAALTLCMRMWWTPLQQWRRHRSGCCVACGYACDAGGVCPECGAQRP